MFGNPETTTGGRALKFYSSIRIDIRRIASLKDGETVVGSRTKVKIVKNKVASPFRQAEFDINYGEGISREGELLDMGMEAKIVEKSGAWLSYGDLRIGQGRENAKQFLKENPELSNEIELKLRRHLGLLPPEPADKTPPADAAAREKERSASSGLSGRSREQLERARGLTPEMRLSRSARFAAGALFLVAAAASGESRIEIASARAGECPAAGPPWGLEVLGASRDPIGARCVAVFRPAALSDAAIEAAESQLARSNGIPGLLLDFSTLPSGPADAERFAFVASASRRRLDPRRPRSASRSTSRPSRTGRSMRRSGRRRIPTAMRSCGARGAARHDGGRHSAILARGRRRRRRRRRERSRAGDRGAAPKGRDSRGC
jgi:hypothetical protein